MSLSTKLNSLITLALESLGISDASFVIETPADLSHGDYATNAALVVSKQLGKNPREIADLIKSHIESQQVSDIASVEIAGPGFINFRLSRACYSSGIAAVLNEQADFGRSSTHVGHRVLVEHSSPNLFKPFHIGHMMNNAIGESLVRIMRFSGAAVETMSFPSDISLGVAKAVWYMLEKGGMDFLASEEFLSDKINHLGNAYVEGTKAYEADESIHARVKEIADNLYASKPSPEYGVFQVCKDINIAYFEEVTKRLGSHFDSYIYESEAGRDGKNIVVEYTPKVFTQSEGAIVYIPDESKKGLNTAVFINSQGNPTYEAKDIGLLDLKFSRINPDLSLFVTDHEQIPHFKIVLDAAEHINSAWVGRSVHVPHGRMTFKGQKMSSRLGGVPVATEMLDTVIAEVGERSQDRGPISAEDADAIAIAAIKFAILRSKPGQNIDFNPDTSLSFEGDSGPYLQYTYARINSLIEKALALGITLHLTDSVEVSDLERVIMQFPNIVDSAVREYAPQHIVTYLLELAREFNSFYGANKIVDAENIGVSAHRLALARATQIVIKNGLYLLGINAPERM